MRLNSLFVTMFGGTLKASLLCQKIYIYGAGYVMQTSKCINLQIMHYDKVF